jgi:hypothetical protein
MLNMHQIQTTMQKRTSPNDLKSNISLFLKELPDATRCQQSVYRKELSIDDKTVILVAQQIKGIHGMTWKVNVY